MIYREWFADCDTCGECLVGRSVGVYAYRRDEAIEALRRYGHTFSNGEVTCCDCKDRKKVNRQEPCETCRGAGLKPSPHDPEDWTAEPCPDCQPKEGQT